MHVISCRKKNKRDFFLTSNLWQKWDKLIVSLFIIFQLKDVLFRQKLSNSPCSIQGKLSLKDVRSRKNRNSNSIWCSPRSDLLAELPYCSSSYHNREDWNRPLLYFQMTCSHHRHMKNTGARVDKSIVTSERKTHMHDFLPNMYARFKFCSEIAN